MIKDRLMLREYTKGQWRRPEDLKSISAWQTEEIGMTRTHTKHHVRLEFEGAAAIEHKFSDEAQASAWIAAVNEEAATARLATFLPGP